MASNMINDQQGGSLVVIAWNGVSRPCTAIDFDVKPDFKILLFNYSGNGHQPPEDSAYHFDLLVSQRTEFKGQLLSELYYFLKDNNSFEYIGIVDDDIRMKISDINQLLCIAGSNGLDACQPSLAHDSYHSFEFNMHQPGIEFLPVPWVEIMCPFYKKKLFDACYPLCKDNISSYGIDKYAIPFYQQLLNMRSVAVIHAVQITHLKPVTDGDKRFSNGLTARQEGERLRKNILELIHAQYQGQFSKNAIETYFSADISQIQHLKAGLRVFVKKLRSYLDK